MEKLKVDGLEKYTSGIDNLEKHQKSYMLRLIRNMSKTNITKLKMIFKIYSNDKIFFVNDFIGICGSDTKIRNYLRELRMNWIIVGIDSYPKFFKAPDSQEIKTGIIEMLGWAAKKYKNILFDKELFI